MNLTIGKIMGFEDTKFTDHADEGGGFMSVREDAEVKAALIQARKRKVGEAPLKSDGTPIPPAMASDDKVTLNLGVYSTDDLEVLFNRIRAKVKPLSSYTIPELLAEIQRRTTGV